MKWIAWANVTLAEAANRLFQSLPPEQQGDPSTNADEKVTAEQKSAIAMEQAKSDLCDCLRILDGGLEGRSFLLTEYSLVDTHLQGIVGWIGSMNVDLKPFSNVTGWLQRCYERPAIANRARAALLLSIHADGGPSSGHGFHVIEPVLVKGYTEDIVGPSHALATALIEAMIDNGFTPSTYVGRGGRSPRKDLGTLNRSDVPAVIVEVGNMRNARDAAIMTSAEGRERRSTSMVS